MEHVGKRRLVKALLLAWAIVYFLYTLLGVWAGTGKDALAGPSTPTNNMLAEMWLCYSAVQLIAAAALNKQYAPPLFWTSIALAILSVAMIIVPVFVM